ANRELLAALVAPVPTRPHRLSAQRSNGIKAAAMRTVRAIRPANRLESDPSGIVIVVAGMGKSGWKGHLGYLLEIEDSRSARFSKGDNRHACSIARMARIGAGYRSRQISAYALA